MSEDERRPGEAAFIQKFFAPLARDAPGAFSLEDDAAAFAIADGHDLVTTVDAVTAGIHFFETDKPADIAWSALAVNVSDLVAKGAEPHHYVMALSLPEKPDPVWMTEFCSGLGAAQSVFRISLIGGDTDVGQGPLSVTITALGSVPSGAMVRRSGAKPGDKIYLSGTIGDAGLGLALRRQADLANTWNLSEDATDFLQTRSCRPRPHTRAWPLVRSFASAAIDISDGLVKDANSLARASRCGMTVNCAHLPVSQPAREVVAAGGVDARALLTEGGDYEILMTVPQTACSDFEEEARGGGVPVTQIGEMTDQGDPVFLGADGSAIAFSSTGYDHFERR